MARRMRLRFAAISAVIVVAIVVIVIVPSGDDPGSERPRVRVSVPGLDSELDLFADRSDADEGGETQSDVIEVDNIDQIEAAFDAGQGHPRLILLVDPI